MVRDKNAAGSASCPSSLCEHCTHLPARDHARIPPDNLLCPPLRIPRIPYNALRELDQIPQPLQVPLTTQRPLPVRLILQSAAGPSSPKEDLREIARLLRRVHRFKVAYADERRREPSQERCGLWAVFADDKEVFWCQSQESEGAGGGDT